MLQKLFKYSTNFEYGKWIKETPSWGLTTSITCYDDLCIQITGWHFKLFLQQLHYSGLAMWIALMYSWFLGMRQDFCRQCTSLLDCEYVHMAVAIFMHTQKIHNICNQCSINHKQEFTFRSNINPSRMVHFGYKAQFRITAFHTCSFFFPFTERK
jgi:hypothetical protein